MVVFEVAGGLVFVYDGAVYVVDGVSKVVVEFFCTHTGYHTQAEEHIFLHQPVRVKFFFHIAHVFHYVSCLTRICDGISECHEFPVSLHAVYVVFQTGCIGVASAVQEGRGSDSNSYVFPEGPVDYVVSALAASFGVVGYLVSVVAAGA